ncbi:putative 3-oxo-5-alpha-steroid 4-dehydrogenase [Talaromyces proteolyticus]|uniref:Polyprenal reductase n=1 Tax=Talaromyces proteolyticus TaxID=1131652 RepID=A0AAD4KHY3_9EURO|nr:putative 3-oxo-5-alpha-steroid 4-dehydrogenase [Talaromyces proteolyticus]KAH8692857.1 putative 3-oxo-5-alpha-steroid 4-dehydrogenase [Talaromyces proteolyticus]
MAANNDDTIFESLLGIDIIDAVRACFIFAACTTLLFTSLPALNSRFVNYGARSSSTAKTQDGDSTPKQPSSDATVVTSVLDRLATWQVPHRYFTHYYITLLLSSAFWINQLLTHGPAFRFVVANTSSEHLQKSMTLRQVLLCIGLVVIQGVRRLYESFAFAKPSSSRMGVVHWLLGLSFYLGVTIAIWIEGLGAVLSNTLTLDDFRVTVVPTLKTLLFLPVFLMASGLQHDCHHYLSSLKKYTVPTHPLFTWVVSPHYTAECVIYLSLTFLAAPEGEFLNKTILCGLFFVVVNLGGTARNSQKWYKEKFGEESIRGKWIMIPGIY